MTAIDRVRIIVLGDSGVGKTSFVHLAATGEQIRSPSWTIGCACEVKLHEYREGTKDQQTYFIEYWDVGGSRNHANARHCFYHPLHGIILVHDLSNRKSEVNLQRWSQEILDLSSEEYDSESFLGVSQIPILVIGTKLDLVQHDRLIGGGGQNRFAEQCGADEIMLDCRQSRYLAAGTSNAVKLSRFYDRVIEMRHDTESKRSFDELYHRSSTTVSPVLLPSKFYSPHQD